MVIRKYTKKRRRKSLRKFRGGTVTVDQVNVRKAERIAPDKLFTRMRGFDVERRRDGRRVGLVHSENARSRAPRTPPPMTAREREARFKALERERADPEERRRLFETDVQSLARAVAARGRRRGEKRFEGLDNRTSTCWDLIDPKDRIDCREITQRQLDRRKSNLRPTRRSASRSPPASTRSPPALTRSASRSPPASTRSPPALTRSASRSPPASTRLLPLTAWGGRTRRRRTQRKR